MKSIATSFISYAMISYVGTSKLMTIILTLIINKIIYNECWENIKTHVGVLQNGMNCPWETCSSFLLTSIIGLIIINAYHHVLLYNNTLMLSFFRHSHISHTFYPREYDTYSQVESNSNIKYNRYQTLSHTDNT